MIEFVRGDLVEVDGKWMVETPDGLAEPNSMELMRVGVPKDQFVKPWLMSPEEFDRFRQECLKEALRRSGISDEEYAERLRRDRIRREGLGP